MMQRKEKAVDSARGAGGVNWTVPLTAREKVEEVSRRKGWGYSAVWARSPVPRFIFWCPIRQTLGHRGGPGTVATSLYLDMRSHSKSMAEVGLEPWSCLAFGQLHWYFYQVLYIQTV